MKKYFVLLSCFVVANGYFMHLEYPELQLPFYGKGSALNVSFARLKEKFEIHKKLNSDDEEFQLRLAKVNIDRQNAAIGANITVI